MMNLNNIFDEDGLIAQHLGTYEFRVQQMQMAKAVEEAVQSRKHLLVEAGTGVGKSLAYLVPFIQWAKKFDKKVAVSTYTKTLQEQLVKKDLPFLHEILGLDFNYTLCVGAQNYLCLRRLTQGYKNDLFDSDRELGEIERITGWAEETATGLYAELDFEPSEYTWGKICREADLCLGRKCTHRKECFYNKAKEKENKADILVVNHHLFFANLASGGRVLPNFEALVFDEAHTLEDVATEYLGIEISNLKIKYFLDTVFNPQTGKGLLKRIRKINRDKAEKIGYILDEVRNAADTFFAELSDRFGQESKVQRIRNSDYIFNYLEDPLSKLICSIQEVLDDVEELEDRIEIKSLLGKAEGIHINLKTLITQSMDGYVWWVEIATRPRRHRYSLFGAPVDVSGEFKLKVLDTIRPVVFTSATLSTNGNFDFIKESLGIEDAHELLLSSPFDYHKQALLYIPKELPDPNRAFESYQQEAIEEIRKIVEIVEGRTFVLFTSYRMLEAANNVLKHELGHFHILKQGDAPRYKLLERFKSHARSVLLGTSTFWQGVDVPGRALECVIITKLPFAVPDEPIIEAKMELLTAQGKDPFIHYQVPQAIIMLRQGFGRLIRRKTDIGMVAILDPRIKTRFYGKSFLVALPDCRRVSSLAEVEHFFLVNNRE
jgi:ATP-dependent DNA helicase DinG